MIDKTTRLLSGMFMLSTTIAFYYLLLEILKFLSNLIWKLIKFIYFQGLPYVVDHSNVIFKLQYSYYFRTQSGKRRGILCGLCFRTIKRGEMIKMRKYKFQFIIFISNVFFEEPKTPNDYIALYKEKSLSKWQCDYLLKKKAIR